MHLSSRTVNFIGLMAIPIGTFLLLISTLLPGATANAQDPTITYNFRNNGKILPNINFFEFRLKPWAQNKMPLITSFIRDRILCRDTQTHTQVILQGEDMLPPPHDDFSVSGNTINMSVGSIRGRNDWPAYLEGTLYHEMTHVWQFREGYSYGGPTWALVEGIADYAAIKAGHIQYRSCCPDGRTWYERGYCHTAHFLLYLERAQYHRVVCRVNEMLKTGYDERNFTSILNNTSPQVLWNTYLETLKNAPPPLLQHCHNNHTDLATY